MEKGAVGKGKTFTRRNCRPNPQRSSKREKVRKKLYTPEPGSAYFSTRAWGDRKKEAHI